MYSASGAKLLAQYLYGTANDADARWSPDVTTHTLTCRLWGRADAEAHSGDGSIQLNTGPVTYTEISPFGADLRPIIWPILTDARSTASSTPRLRYISLGVESLSVLERTP